MGDCKSMASNSNRIIWLDGIKGISCLFIILHHFFLTAAPAIHYGRSRGSTFFGLDYFLSESPFGFFLNGNFLVNVFVFITGFVITYQILHMDKNRFGVFNVKRYLKLAFPIFSFCILYWIFRKLGAIHGESFSLKHAVIDGLFRILFLGEHDMNGVFWMMHYIFLGGIFVSVTASCSWFLSKAKTIAITALVIFFLLIQRQWLYTAVFSGSLLCLVFYAGLSEKAGKYKFVFSVLLIPAIILGNYPTGYFPSNFYRFITLSFSPVESSYIWHLCGAVLAVVSISCIPSIQKFFELNILQRLSKISFLMYIFHPSAINLLKPVYDFTYEKTGLQFFSNFIYLGFILLVLIIFCELFNRYVNSIFNRVVNFFLQRDASSLSEKNCQ